MNRPPRINAHAHLLPYPEQIPQSIKAKEIFWIDDQRQFMYQKDWKRPITDPSFFVDRKLEWMDSQRIDHEVILTLSQLYGNGATAADAMEICRFQNDFHAETQRQHPDKFTCGFIAPLAYTDLALQEMDRAVHELGLKVFCIPTHYRTQAGQWISTADRDLAPIYEYANELGLAVEVHPYDGPKFISLPDMYWRYHLVWMCAQTADHYHFFTLLDYPRKYPNIRTCYAHGNQFGQVNIGRRATGFTGRPDLFEDATDPLKSVGAKNVYFDSIVHDVLSFELLLKRSGSSQIIAGLDNPYPLGEMDCDGCYPGKVIDEAVHGGLITAALRDDMWYANVVRWLGFDPTL